MTPGPFAHDSPLSRVPAPSADRSETDRQPHRTREAAATSGSLTDASAVYNLAALIASDCGLPELAHQWCLDHANAYLRAPHQGAQVGRNILEPVVNLARLHIRANDGESADQLLSNLYQAVTEKADIEVDGLVIPASVITDKDEHQAVRQWLWAVLLADGRPSPRQRRPLGRGPPATPRLQRRRGPRLDGRQVAVIAHAQAGDLETAQHLIATTAPGDQPWLGAVTACLAVLCQDDPSPDLITDMVRRYERLSVPPDIAVFGVRLGLTVMDAATGPHPGVARQSRRDSSARRSPPATATPPATCLPILASPPFSTRTNVPRSSRSMRRVPWTPRSIAAHLRDDIDAALAESRAVLARRT